MSATKTALVLLFIVACTRALITKNNKAYSGIVVAIHNSVAENPELLVKTLNALTETSELLYKVTREQAFFGEITLAVPMSWNASSIKSAISGLNSVSYEKNYGDFFREAAIRIDGKNSAYEDAPYTLQTGGCGEAGEYIHLTPDFLLDKGGVMTEIYGPKDRQMVHEWMHLRYGIFDEYGLAGDEIFPLYYLEDGKMHVSACDRNIKGWIETPDGEPCQVHDGYISENCRFFPDSYGSNATASLMSLPYMPSIKEFCDKDSEENNGHRHNSKAPTKHNYLCDGLSVWEVMRGNEDFLKPANKDEPYVPPKIRVVQPESRDPRFILVLDVSSSMNPHTAILHTAGTTFVEDQLPEGSYIGIVTYSTNAQTVQDLVKINSGNRKSVSGRVPKSAGGMTAIGSGLLEALNVIKRGNQPTEGATIVLMTDGAENQSPRINDVIPNLVQAKVKVNTLAFGTQASQLLENVAIATKGKTYFFDPKGGGLTADLKNIFADTVTIQADIDLQSEQIMREAVDITAVQKTMVMRLDRELGKNTLFVLSGEVASVELEVVSPSGTRYNSASKEYEKDVNIKKRIHIHLPLAEHGLWNVTIIRSGSALAKVEMLMTSEPRNPDDQPIRVRAWLDSIKVQFPQVPSIFAQVTKGNDAIIKANVEATIRTPNGVHTIILLDDGAGADRLPNDGIYSAYFTQFSANGRYAVFASVINNGTALIKRSRITSGAPAIPKSIPQGRLNKISSSSFDLSYFVQTADSQEPLEAKYNKSDDFTRTADGGSFSMEGFTANVDRIPPNRVTDLRVISSKKGDDGIQVTLQWTSPGDNMDVGNASSLEIRFSLNNEDLKNDKFESAVLLKESDLIEGSLMPVPGKQKQIIITRIPEGLISNSIEKALDIYVALRASDEHKNIAKASNIVSAHFGYKIPDKVPDKVNPEVKCNKRHFKNKLLLKLIVENTEEL